jgi:hypothetical protein
MIKPSTPIFFKLLSIDTSKIVSILWYNRIFNNQGGNNMRHHCAPLLIGGIVFTINAIGHILRLFYHWTVVIGGNIIPEYVSVIGVVVSGVLAIWMFSAVACKEKNGKKN